MARINWTPIVAPDIGESAIRAQAMAGSALSGAFAGFSGLLNDWENARRDKNLAELYTRQNAFAANNDVAGYSADLADGDLMGDLKYLRPQDIAAARSFTNELRSGRNAEFSFGRQKLEAERADDAFARAERNRETGILVARQRNFIEGEVAAGRMTEAQGREAALALSNQTEDPFQIDSAFSAVTSGIAANRGNTRFDWEKTNFENGVEDRRFRLEDRADQRAAAALIEKYQGLGGNFSDLEASPEWQNATPQQRILIRQAFGSTAPEGAAGSFAVNMDEARTTVSSYLQSQGASAAAIAGIMGNLEVEGGYGGALGDGGSASGIAQWREERRAAFRQRYGKDPHEASHREQAQFLTWELLSPEGRAVSGVSEANARRIWNATDPAEAARLFDQFYERSNGKHRERRVAAARSFFMPSAAQNTEAAQRTQVNASTRMGTDGARWMIGLPQAFADNSSLAAVAERAVSSAASEGRPASPLAGQNRNLVQDELRNIQDRYTRENPGKRITPAAALIILEQSVLPYGGTDFFNINRRPLRRRGFVGAFTGDQMVIDADRVGQAIDQIQFDKSGNVIGLNDTITREAANQASLAGAQASLQKVETLRAQVSRQRAEDLRLRRFNNPVTFGLEQQLIAAQAELEAINAQGSRNTRAYSGR